VFDLNETRGTILGFGPPLSATQPGGRLIADEHLELFVVGAPLRRSKPSPIVKRRTFAGVCWISFAKDAYSRTPTSAEATDHRSWSATGDCPLADSARRTRASLARRIWRLIRVAIRTG
jgi:hypothetical protein